MALQFQGTSLTFFENIEILEVDIPSSVQHHNHLESKVKVASKTLDVRPCNAKNERFYLQMTLQNSHERSLNIRRRGQSNYRKYHKERNNGQ